MKKKSRSKKTNGDYNKGQGIVIIIIILVLIKILTKCDFDEITNKNKSVQPWHKKPAICETLKLSKRECDKKFKNLKTKEGMPDWFIPLVNRITKEGKIKDKNYEPMKPINPHK